MPADGPAVSDDAHISFAKRLAHNDKDMRRAALKKVKRWLVTKSKQGKLNQDEILKIWKGLHYSMWYSDKPLTQESLALDISQIVSLLPDIGDAVNFFGGFCETIAREWVGIDRQRLDKFYMFIKTALKCVLEFCAANDWNDEIVTNVVNTLNLRIINSQCPDSISVFISEHLFSIYSNISSDSTPTLFISEMLSCYLTLLSKTPKRDLSQVIMSNLFNPITSNTVSFKVNHEHLVSFITKVAVQPDILTRNRKLLYRLRNDIASVGGVDLTVSSPLGKHQLEENTVQIENIPNNQEEKEETEEVKPPKKKKKKKVKQPVAESEGTTETVTESKSEIIDVQETPLSTLPPEGAEEISEGAVDTEQQPAEDIPTAETTEVATDVGNVTETDQAEAKKSTTEPTEETANQEQAVVDYAEEDEKEKKVDDNNDDLPTETADEPTDATEGEKEEIEMKEDDTNAESNVAEVNEDVEADQETESVEEVTELTEPSEISPTAPSETEITEEVESSEKRNLRKPASEVTYSTPAKKTGKRKSTRTKKTPKKQADEASVEVETAEQTDNKTQLDEPSEEAALPAEDPISSEPSPKATRSQASLRKRRKKSVTSTPIPNSPSTPGDATLSTKKKVRLSMENNQTFFFKKNTSLESPKPFDSTRTPVKGVLKASPALTRSQAKKKGKSRIKP